MTFFDSFTVTLMIFVGGSVFGFAVLVVMDVRARWTEARLHTTIAKTMLGSHHPRSAPQSPSQAPTTLATLAADGSSQSQSGELIAQRGRGRRRSTIAQFASTAAEAVPMSLRSMRWSRVFKKLALFWTLCYPGISVKLCRMFRCTEVEGEWWLMADMQLQCFSSQWSMYAIVAVVMLAVYTVGLPFGIAVWLWRNRKLLNTPEVRDNLGFLYLLYGTHAYMWAVVELLRKLVLTSLIMLFFDTGSALQITSALLISSFSHVAHALYRPFVSRRAYLLQHGSLAVTTLTYVLA